MEANQPPTSPAPANRRSPHPASGARKVAAAVSVGTFVALTGGFAIGQALSHPSSSTADPTVATDPSGTGTITGPGTSTDGGYGYETDDDDDGYSTDDGYETDDGFRPDGGFQPDSGWGTGGAAPGSGGPVGPANTQSSGS